MSPSRLIAAAILALCLTPQARAQYGLLCSGEECNGSSSRASRTSGNPSKGGAIRINPAAVPIESGFGAEAIFFKNTADLALTKGLGRVGAAISPSNSEETFFGPPGFEVPEKFVDRKQAATKYKSSKYTLATAFNLFKRGSGVTKIEVNLGLMGKHNSDTKATTGGAGLNGTLGPFVFGYSAYSDESQFDYSDYGLTNKPIVKYTVETYSAGIFLSSLIIDYSVLRLLTNDIATVNVITGTLLLGPTITTFSKRTEISDRPQYNFSSKDIETKREKVESFGGFQYRLGRSFMMGVFYNYYLLHELSVGATLFF